MAAGCGAVGGGGNKGGAVGGSGSTGGVGGKGSADSNKTGGTGTSDKTNEAAKTNNVDGAKAKTGIDREPAQKADINAKADQKTVDAKTETAKAETAKAETAKADKAKAEKVAADKAAANSLTDTVKSAVKEIASKATEVAGTVKAEFAKAADKLQKQKELADLARKPEVRAMLDTIGFTEGTGTNYGKVVNGEVIGRNKKDMGFDADLKPGAKNVTTMDMSQHPNVKVQVNKNLVSSAAGRYQFLSNTWNNLSKTLGLPNFHASTQDIAAVQLMKDRKMIEPLLNGDLKTAVNRGAGEWASLPKADGNGAYAGQKAKSFEAIEQRYNDFLKEANWKAMVNDFN